MLIFTGSIIERTEWHSFFAAVLNYFMEQDKTNKSREQKEKEGAPRQPDPETLGTTDPQEHMKGPVSSAVQKVKENVEENGTEDLKRRED